MSDLIEQLGGYEKAKDELRVAEKYGSVHEDVLDHLRFSLLEHRRANNIFEVGDKVVFEAHFCDEHKGSGYGEITYCTMDKRVFEIDNDYLVSIDEIRHAYPQEIEAGCKL